MSKLFFKLGLIIFLPSFLFGCNSAGGSTSEQQIYELTKDDWYRLDKQESVILDLVIENYGEATFEHNLRDLEYIQKILDDEILRPNQTYELQSLGIVFGQVLVSQTGLEWVIVDDEYGRDQALKYPDTSILLFPLTMISKRVEQGEVVDIIALYNWTLDQLDTKSNYSD